MLSKIALLILGLIAEKPLNPYEIKKLFEKLYPNKKLPMSSSSIYATINRLVEKKYISGKRTRQGNMPEKTIYSITKQGEKALSKSLSTYLADTERVFSEFDISMTLICHLNREAALEALAKHRSEVEREIAERKKDYLNHKKAKSIPYTGLLRRMHSIHKREAELTTIKELMKEIENDKDWDHYPVFDLSY